MTRNTLALVFAILTVTACKSSPVDPAGFCSAYADTYCQGCGGDGGSDTACPRTVRSACEAVLLPWFVAAADAGRIRVDGGRLASCAGSHAPACGTLPDNADGWLAGCDSAMDGLVPDGGPCNRDRECLLGLSCDGGSQSPDGATTGVCTDTPCQDECSAGQTRCSGEQLQSCSLGGGRTGCNVWADPAACGGADTCVDGTCVPPCADGETQSCPDVGRCRQGTRTCSGGRFGACNWMLGPVAEICNGIDDDCNGTVDDGVPTPSCPLQDGVCGGARQECRGADGLLCDTATYTAAAAAAGLTYQETEDLCDGVDNDCDGAVDESCDCDPGSTQPCGPESETGTCRKGIATCDASGHWGECAGAVYPQDESSLGCNGLDDDCNGTPDDFTPAEPDNCLQCGQSCPTDPHGTATCQSRSGCGLSCDPGYTDCPDGCFTLDDTSHCGSCYQPCDTGDSCLAAGYSSSDTFTYYPFGCCPPGDCWIGWSCYTEGSAVRPEEFAGTTPTRLSEVLQCESGGSWQQKSVSAAGRCPSGYCYYVGTCYRDGYCRGSGSSIYRCDAPKTWTPVPRKSSGYCSYW